jgi:hypothetical protein
VKLHTLKNKALMCNINFPCHTIVRVHDRRDRKNIESGIPKVTKKVSRGNMEGNINVIKILLTPG